MVPSYPQEKKLKSTVLGNPITTLAEWAQKTRKQTFGEVFFDSYKTSDDGKFICTLQLGLTLQLTNGGPATKKKLALREACEKMIDHLGIEKVNSASVFKVKLVELAKAWYDKSFDEVFNCFYKSDLEGRFSCRLVFSGSGNTFDCVGSYAQTKKESLYHAAKEMYYRLESLGQEERFGKALYLQSYCGDATLKYILLSAIHFREAVNGNVTELNRTVNDFMMIENLSSKIEMVGIRSSKNPRTDAIRVKQWIWEKHKGLNYNMDETWKALNPLLPENLRFINDDHPMDA